MSIVSLVTVSIVTLLGLAIFGAYLAFGTSSADAAKEADPNIVVTLRGTGIPADTPRDVDSNALCFETELFDTNTDRLIGDGLDCLIILDAGAAGMSVDRTTVFNFPEGRMVARGLTTVVPIFGDASPEYTHVVGDVNPNTLNVISGTKRFEDRTGNVRLSGIVNLSDFPNFIEFNCIFVIDLD